MIAIARILERFLQKSDIYDKIKESQRSTAAREPDGERRDAGEDQMRNCLISDTTITLESLADLVEFTATYAVMVYQQGANCQPGNAKMMRNILLAFH